MGYFYNPMELSNLAINENDDLVFILGSDELVIKGVKEFNWGFDFDPKDSYIPFKWN